MDTTVRFEDMIINSVFSVIVFI